MPTDFKNLPGLGGSSNAPGLKKKVLYAPISKFTTIAVPTTQETGEATDVTISGDHTFEIGEGFRTMYTTLDTGKLMSESIGERDGKGHNTKIECFHPGTKAEAVAFSKICQNEEFIVLVEGLDGQYYQVGTEKLGAEMVSNFDSGTVSSGRKGFSFIVETFDMFYLYDGAITEKPAA
jgi:hypothetical protein